jgi:hypothetical protein
MVTMSRRLPLQIYISIGLLLLLYSYLQIRVPVGVTPVGATRMVEWSEALRQIQVFLVSMIVLFLLGVAMIYWTVGFGRVQKTRKEESST